MTIKSKIDIDKLKTVEKIKKEIERFQKFNYILGKGKLDAKLPEVDVKSYAKYILLEGIKQEKRELLECLRGKIYLKDKSVYIKI